MNDKKTIEENNIGTETTIEMSLRLLEGMEKSELMDTLESEEDREKQRKLDELSEGKLTRRSEDALFLRKEIIEALKRSDEKTDEEMEQFLQRINHSVGTQLQGMNSSIVKMKEEDDRYKQFNERITNVERKILDMDENTKIDVTNPGEHMLTRIKVRQ